MNETTPGIGALGQYGAGGIVVAVLLGLFLWAFRTMFGHVLESWKKSQEQHQEYMRASVNAIKELADVIRDNHATVQQWFDDITERINLVANAQQRPRLPAPGPPPERTPRPRTK